MALRAFIDYDGSAASAAQANRVDADWLNAVDALKESSTTVRAHGATGSGLVGTATAETAAVQAAFDSGAAHIIFDPGYTFVINSITIPLTVQRITVYGATVLRNVAGETLLIDGMFIRNAANGLGPLLVEGGTIGSNDTGDKYASRDNGFYFDTVTRTISDMERVTFRDVTFQSFRGHAVRTGWTHTITFEHCRFIDCSGHINCYTSKMVTLRDCFFGVGPYTGLLTVPSVALNTIPEPTVSGDTDEQVRFVHITSNTWQGWELHQSLLVHGTVYGHITNNQYEDCNAPISVHDNGTVGSYERHDYLIIALNTMRGTADYGDLTHGDLYKHGAAIVYFNVAIEVSGNALVRATNVVITSNTIMHFGYGAEAVNAGDSLQVGAILSNGQTENLTITNNTFVDCYSAAVCLKGSHLGLTISNNTTRSILDPGGGNTGCGVRILDGSPTGKVVSGDIYNNTFDTVNTGVRATQTTLVATNLRVYRDNRCIGVTTPYAQSTDETNRFRAPRMLHTATPVDVDASCTEYVMVEVDIATVVLNAPTNPKDGAVITYQIYNVSGLLTTLTRNAVFHGPAFVTPAAGAMKEITCRYESARGRWNDIARVDTAFA